MTSTATTARWARPFVVLAAIAAALVVWVVEHSIAGIGLEVELSGRTREVGVGAVLLTSLSAGLAGWLLVDLLERRSRNPRRSWLLLSVIGLGFSLIGPLGLAATAIAAVSLVCLHGVVALVLVPGLARTLGRVGPPR